MAKALTLRRSALRISFLIVIAAGLLFAVDAVVFVAATHNAWRLVPTALSDGDLLWWKSQFGQAPIAIDEYIDPPPAIMPRNGSWYYKDGGHGGAGAPITMPAASPISLIAYAIQPSPPFADWPVLRGRALASAEGTAAYRVGVPLPFVFLQRLYAGKSSDFVPSPADDQWQTRIQPMALIGNLLVLVGVFGFPIWFRDARSLVRRWSGQCAACGYSLQGLLSGRCPECGAATRRAL